MRNTLGSQLARLASQRKLDAYQIEKRHRAMNGRPVLSAESITRVFESGGSLGSARAVAARLGRLVKVVGWKNPHRRFVDAAAASGLAENTAANAIRTLDDLAGAPDNIHMESLERMLATCPGAELRIYGGRDD